MHKHLEIPILIHLPSVFKGFVRIFSWMNFSIKDIDLNSRFQTRNPKVALITPRYDFWNYKQWILMDIITQLKFKKNSLINFLQNPRKCSFWTALNNGIKNFEVACHTSVAFPSHYFLCTKNYIKPSWVASIRP